jgi:biotin transport system substrate-specific component
MSTSTSRDLVLAGLFAALTAVGAFLRIPLEPVPFTLQPLVVLLAGAILTPRAALMSQLVYLVVGLMGLPVFARGGGPAYILQPTFGFLIGFAVGAWVIARLVHVRRAPGAAYVTLALLVGMAAIYACGVLGLYLNLVIYQGKAGVFPTVVWGLGAYLGFDLLKVGIAACLVRPVRAAISLQGATA